MAGPENGLTACAVSRIHDVEHHPPPAHELSGYAHPLAVVVREHHGSGKA